MICWSSTSGLFSPETYMPNDAGGIWRRRIGYQCRCCLIFERGSADDLRVTITNDGSEKDGQVHIWVKASALNTR